MIDYTKIKIEPDMTVGKAFQTVVKHFLPKYEGKIINKVADLILKDDEYRKSVLWIMMRALEENCGA